jgi:hypothetical protein
MESLAGKKSFKKFAYLKVEDILAYVKEKDLKQSIDKIKKYFQVSKGVT